MNLTDSRLKQLDDPTLALEARALLRCQVAAELIHVGRYEEAREALGELWPGIGKCPTLKGVSTSTAGEVLLQCGVLSGWLGSVRSIPDVQERAKDLLTEALRKFQSRGEHAKASEAKYELSLCYFRLGAYDEARIVLDEALDGLKDEDTLLKAKILIRRSFIEIWTGRHHDALIVLEEARPFFESCGDAVKGRWHNHMALALQRLATAEGRIDYADRAIMEFTAAAYHFEQANHESYRARAFNNLAMLLYRFGRHDDAHENLDQAAAIFANLDDKCSLAQVQETRARVLVAEQRYREAGRTIAEAIRAFEKGGESALLADALTIRGVVLSKLRDYDASLHTLRRATNLAEDSGASSSAGLAALALIEEHGESRLPESELCRVYLRADRLLRNTQDAEEVARLRSCARILARRLSASHAVLGDEYFSLPDVVLAYEGRLIEQALELEGGKLTRAARRLGVTRQRLTHILQTRHRNLLHKRAPAARLRSYTGTREPRRITTSQQARPAAILLVEDHPEVADAVKGTLELEGGRVEVRADALMGRRELEGDAHFDLLILDYELPGGTNGVELIRLARQLPHRRRTPIIMLSASDVEGEALGAGANLFLRKPDDIGKLAETVTRLLAT